MILTDPFARPPAPPRSRVRRAWDRLRMIAIRPVARVVGFTFLLMIWIRGY